MAKTKSRSKTSKRGNSKKGSSKSEKKGGGKKSDTPWGLIAFFVLVLIVIVLLAIFLPTPSPTPTPSVKAKGEKMAIDWTDVQHRAEERKKRLLNKK